MQYFFSIRYSFNMLVSQMQRQMFCTLLSRWSTCSIYYGFAASSSLSSKSLAALLPAAALSILFFYMVSPPHNFSFIFDNSEKQINPEAHCQWRGMYS